MQISNSVVQTRKLLQPNDRQSVGETPRRNKQKNTRPTTLLFFKLTHAIVIVN